MENSSMTYAEDYEEEYIFADPRLQAVLLVLYSLVFLFCFFGSSIFLTLIDRVVSVGYLWDSYLLIWITYVGWEIISFVLSILGNFTVVLVMALHWKMRGSTKFCLGNLAFANLCVGIFCIYQDLSMYLIDSWVFGKFLCKMYHFTNNLAHTTTILIQVVIAIERYFAIRHPFRSRRLFTTRRLRLVILGVWILSALLCSPRLYYVVTVTNQLPGRKGEPMRYEVICTLQLSIYDSSTAAMIQFIVLFLFPLIIISILYAKVGFFLRQREVFVCSFVQGSTAVTEGDSSGVGVLLQRSKTRNSIIVNLNRVVSFKQDEAGGNKSQEKTEPCEDCVHVQGSTGPNIPVISEESANSNSNSLVVTDSFQKSGKEDLERQESTKSWSSSSESHQRLQRNHNPGTSNPHKGVVRLLVIILITFAVCNFPFHLRKLYQDFCPHSDSDSVWAELATPLSFLLMYANCAINPILYAFLSQSFRSSFMDCVRCRVRKPSHS